MGLKIGSIVKVSLQCQQCNGKCWVPDNQSKTQQNAVNCFGFIPNKCVNSSHGAVQCPAALGNL